ncbi:phospho-sugar mutase [Pyramidobacter sp.]|uniref:phospho-sugar mutase n=1 Tax=Pyramidobacter sp. TaxID=1943581 RepID=UPI0025DF61B1|nr:phospho-sugar mutase [Pyramidobacter sp.]MCI7403189.1 phospho-sugar mutase [Pyramidobacter sp.]MDY3211959.1 phospho-sugar mutase [Pyramidobacter sp.]
MTYRERYEQWLGASWLDEASRRELAALSDEKEIEDRFYRDLEFGTAGMRGVMGAGTNRLNRYTVGKATLGLARYLKAEIADWQRGVVVAYDSRNRSSEFALETARVLSACGVPVKIFRQLEPVPALSFAVKHHKAAAGVVITASHNPKEYNGYKVYDEHGCQLCPAPAAKLTRYVEAADLAQIPPGDEKLIAWIGQETVEAFLDAVQCQSVPQRDAGALKVVYTPLHGSGNLPVRAILKRCGFADVQVVAEQELPDGDFPTVTAPNPEERSTLSLGIELARRVGADVVIGTDPDSDRIGCAVAAGGEFRLLSGNQIGALLADFVLSHRALTPKSTMITTIVTGELGARVAQSRGVAVLRTLTGFKYIGEKITEFARSGEREFLFGYEESYGYLAGTHAQDKDAVVAAMLICEMAAAAKSQGRTLIDKLDGLYARFGYYLDAQESHTLKGKDGAERIAAMMARLRGGARFEGVSQTLDYAQGLDGLPRENVMKFLCADGSWFAVRPSGTEPKIKIYYSIKDADETSARAKLDARRAEVGGVLGL